MRFLKRVIISTLLLLGVLMVHPSFVYGYDYGMDEGLTNNGSDRSSSNNGMFLQNNKWGAYSVIWPHKVNGNQAGDSATFYYAKERGISLPESIGIDEDLDINLYAVGYAHYLYSSETDDEPVYIRVEAYLADVGIWIDTRMTNSDGSPLCVSGYYNNPRASSGEGPYYNRSLNVDIKANNWPSYASGHKIGAIRISVNNSFDRNLGDTDIYCIDCMSLSVRRPSNPELDWITVNNADYHSNTTNDYWYKSTTPISITDTMHDYRTELKNLYLNLHNGLSVYNSSSLENSRALSIGNSTDNNSYWTDILDTVKFDSSYTKAKYDAGDNHQRQQTFITKAKAENDYAISVSAVNRQDRWQLPSKNKDKPIDVNKNVRIDDTAPICSSFNSYDNQISYIKFKIQDIKDLDSKKTKNGSGFNNARIFMYPESTQPELSNISLWSKSYSSVSDNSLDIPYYYPNQYSSYFGRFNVIIRLTDNVGNYRDYKTTVMRCDPNPEDPSVRLTSYKYKDPGNSDYWVNTKDSFTTYQSIYSNKNYSIAVGYPTGLTINIRKPNNSVLYSDTTTRSGFNLNSSSLSYFSNNGIKSVSASQESTGEKRKFISITRTLKANDSSHGLKLNIYGQGYTTYQSKNYFSPWVLERDKKILCVDGKAPTYIVKKIGRSEISLDTSDTDSGVYSIVLYSMDNTQIFSKIFNKSESKKTTSNQIVNVGNNNKVKMVLVDNVGNSTTSYIDNCITIVNSSLEVNDINLPKVTDSAKVDNTVKSKIGSIGVIKDNRRFLKVKALGEVTSNSIPNFTPIFRFVGQGANVSLTPNYVISEVQGKLNRTIYIDDNTNTPAQPNVVYAYNNSSASLKWDDMKDPELDYYFGIYSKVSNREDFVKGIDSQAYNVKFASGYKNFKFSIWSVSGNGVLPSGKAIVSKTEDFKEFIMNYYESGWYYVECTMYDFNNNPSGTRKLWFYHTKPSIYTNISLSVTAVKDITWEKEVYPLQFGSNGLNDIENSSNISGKDKEKFPLGKVYKFNGHDISQGYSINYKISRVSQGTIDSLKVNYKFTGSKGELITIKSGDRLLSSIDSSEKTEYTTKIISGQDFTNFCAGKELYMKHYVPANSICYTVSGQQYHGYVTVNVEFTQILGGTSVVRSIPIYTFNTEHTALDDINGDKQR